MNLAKPGDAGEFRLRGIACNKQLGEDMLRGGNMDKIPSPGMTTLGMAGAQFIAPLQEIGQPMDSSLSFRVVSLAR